MVNKQYTIQHQHARRPTASGAKRYSPPPVRNHSVISDTPNPNPNSSRHITDSTTDSNKLIDSSYSDSLSQKNLDTINEEQSSKSVFGRNINFYNQQFTNQPSREYGFSTSSLGGEDHRFSAKDLSINDIGRFQYILQMDREMGTHSDSIYRIPSRTSTSSKSNSINSSNHVNFWKADSELPIASATTECERRRYMLQRHLDNFWKYAKWPLILIISCILLGTLIYFLAASRKQPEPQMIASNKREIGNRFNGAQTIIDTDRTAKTKGILAILESNTKAVSELAGIKPTKTLLKSSTLSTTQEQSQQTETTKISTKSSSTTKSMETTARSSSTSRATTSTTKATTTKTTVQIIPIEIVTKQVPREEATQKQMPIETTTKTPPLEITTKRQHIQTTMKIVSPKMTMKSISFATTKLKSISAEPTTSSTSAETIPTLPPFRNTQIVKISTQDGADLEEDYVSTTEIMDKDGKSIAPTKDTIQAIGFTSGHQNNFGIPIEEDERILRILNEELIRNGQNESLFLNEHPTTDSSIYKARVSPTLPILYRDEGTTERIGQKQNVTDVRMCRSTSLGICRGILRYDLTTIKSKRNLTALELEHFKYLIDSKCSVRATEFVCSALEPECRPTQMGILQPCKRICKSILEPCASIIASSEILTTTFDCDSYPDSSDRNVCEDPTRRGKCYENEFKCLDSSCIPLQWKCDNIKDCSLGEDEDNCLFCEHEEFRCQSTDKCIPDKWRCDQYNDCPDGSDELDCFDYDEAAELADDELSGPRIYSFSSIQSPNEPNSRPYLTISEEDRLNEDEKDDSQFPPTAQDSIEYLNGNQTNETSLKDENEEIQKGAASGRIVVGVPKNLANFQDSKEIMMTSDSETDFKYSATNQTTTTMRTGETTTPEGSCPENKLRCVSGKCITVEQICDKTIDCPDGADEAMCVYKD